VTRFGQSDGKTPAGIFLLITYPGLLSQGPTHICVHSELLNSQVSGHFPGWSNQDQNTKKSTVSKAPLVPQLKCI